MKRFKLKDGISNADISKLDGIRDGGTWVQKDCVSHLHFPLGSSISLDVGFPEDLSKWDDFDYAIVLDDDFCQPYTPFYKHFEDPENPAFPFLCEVFKAYIEAMESIPVLEEGTD